MVGPLRGPHSSNNKKKRGGVRRTRGDVEPCCLRSMSCGSLTQPRLANTTVPVFCRWVACHRRLCNSIYFSRRCYNRAVILLWHYCQAAFDLKPKKEDGKKYAEGLKRSNLPIECAAWHKDLMFDALFVGGLLAHLGGSAHSMSTPLHELGF